MISNKAILKKLEEKAGDERTFQLLLEFLKIESEHKQFKKPYKELIENDVKGGKNEI